MKIAFIGGFAFSPKGTMRARAHPLAAELVKLGHEVTIFLTPYDNPEDLGRAWELEGVRIWNAGSPVPTSPKTREVSGTRLISYPRMLTQLIRAVKQYSPDLVHVFKPKGFAGAAGTYFLLRGTPPLVLDCDDWEGWGGWNEVKRYPWLVKEYIDRQERWMIRRASAVTVASRALETRAAQLRPGVETVFYVPNCGAAQRSLELQEEVRRLPREGIRREFGFGDEPVILYSGHFEDQASVEFFCRAAARVAGKHRAAVVFVGDGPPKATIKNLFAGVENARLIFMPHLPYEAFLGLIHACDVPVFPYPDDAVHSAKCSARILDYMAMGKPVLTSVVGQNAEYIIDGESGLLAAASDEEDFAQKLDRLLSEADLRNILGENARRRVRERFRWNDAPLRQCLAAYQHVLGGASRTVNVLGHSAAWHGQEHGRHRGRAALQRRVSRSE